MATAQYCLPRQASVRALCKGTLGFAFTKWEVLARFSLCNILISRVRRSACRTLVRCRTLGARASGCA